MKDRLPAVLSVILTALIVALLGAKPAQPDVEPNPCGTWGFYFGDAPEPAWFVVITPIKRGWQTQWVVNGQSKVHSTGTMQRGPMPGTFLEHYDFGKMVTYLWTWQDGGAVCHDTWSNWNLRKP